MTQHILLLGGMIIDQYLLANEFPIRGEDTLLKKSFYRVGGCAINVAVTLQNLGLYPHVISVIGKDENGNKINEYILEQGLSREAIKVKPNGQTGFCISIIENSGERTFLTLKGCEAEFYFQMISDELLNKTSFLFVTGYYLLELDYAQSIIQFVQKAKNLGIKILFDPGSLVSKINQTILLSMIKLADIITPNEGELTKIVDLFQIQKLDWFFNKGVHWLIEKKGSHGVNLWKKSKNNPQFIPAYQLPSVDTSGAGDSFAGGLIYGILQGFDIEKSTQIASACGALTTTFMGPHSEFSLDDILKIVGEDI